MPTQRLPPSSLLGAEALLDQSSKLAAAHRCEANANIVPVWSALTLAACRQRLAPFSLLCTGAVKDLRPIERVCGCSSVRGGCKLCACVANTRRSCLPTKAAAFLFALHWSREGSPTNRARLWLPFHASGCKLCACLASTCRNGLPTKAGAIRFALRRSRQGHRPIEQACGCSWCETDANCVPV